MDLLHLDFSSLKQFKYAPVSVAAPVVLPIPPFPTGAGYLDIYNGLGVPYVVHITDQNLNILSTFSMPAYSYKRMLPADYLGQNVNFYTTAGVRFYCSVNCMVGNLGSDVRQAFNGETVNITVTADRIDTMFIT
jgi:hypothetical protein